MGMKFLESKPYRVLEVATNFLLLNLLWLLACVPVFTVYPATAAMFGVVRDWTRGREYGLLSGFFIHFKANFRQSLAVGVVWTLLGAALILNLSIAGQAEGAVRGLLFAGLFAVAFFYAAASAYLFPVMVHYDARWTMVMKNSLLLSVSQPATTVLCLLVVAAMAGATLLLPPVGLVAGSVTAYCVYRLCERAFDRVASIKDTRE